MEPLDLEAFEGIAPEYDAAVEADPWVDRFCTRSEWILSFHLAFGPERPLAAARDGANFVALAQKQLGAAGSGYEPLESMWGFASPLVGRGAVELLPLVIGRSPVVLQGLPLRGPVLPGLLRQLERTHELRPYEFRTRYVASLSGGVDAWFGRRSRRLRQGLRRVGRRVHEAGLQLERHAPTNVEEAEQLYRRITAIERRSWKARTRVPVHTGAMHAFYGQMLPRLARRAGLRIVLARSEAEDCGYLYGGTIAEHFRGLQFSFAEPYRPLGLGNALQLEMIRWLASSGVRGYDLGSQSPYKRRWADERSTTLAVLALPR